MDNMIMDLAMYRIEKSKNDFEATQIMLVNKLYSQSLNWSYYSIFHAVRAILAFEQFDSKKHSGIIAYFNRNFIASNKFDKQFAKILMGAEKIRNKSDYNDFYIASREDAESQIQNAKKFINEMEDYINKNFK